MKWRIVFTIHHLDRLRLEEQKRDLTRKLRSVHPLPKSFTVGNHQATIEFEVNAESNFAACHELERIRDQLESEDFSEYKFRSKNPETA